MSFSMVGRVFGFYSGGAGCVFQAPRASKLAPTGGREVLAESPRATKVAPTRAGVVMRLLAAAEERIAGKAGLVERGGRGQDVADHAVPAHHVGGIYIDDVAGAERKAVGQQHGVGRAAVQVEEFGHVAVPAHHVDPLGVGAVLGDVAGVGQGFGQGGALLGHDQRAGLLHFAQHKDLVEAAVLHVEDVAGLEQGVLLGGAGFVHGLDIDAVGGALAGEQHAAVIGLGAEAAGAVDGLEHGEGDVGDFEQAGLGDFAHHIHALAAEGRHADVELHLLDVLGEALGEHVAHLAGGLAGDHHGAHVGVVDGAVFVDHGAGLVGRAVLAGRGGELGVVPDDDGEHVAGADLVVGGGLHGAGLAVGGAQVGVGGGGLLRGRGLELLDDELGSDRLDGDVGGHRLGGVTGLDGQLDGGLLVAQRIGAVTRDDAGAGAEGGTQADEDALAEDGLAGSFAGGYSAGGESGPVEILLHGLPASRK